MTQRFVIHLALAISTLWLPSTIGPATPAIHAEPPASEGPGYFGVTPRISPQGITIIAVTPDSPAEAAGLREGDLLLLLDDEPISAGSRRELMEDFTRFDVGETVEVTFRREKSVKTVEITLVAVPPLNREAQERLAATEKRSEEFQRFDRFLESTDAFEVTVSDDGALLVRGSGKDSWKEVPASVAETLVPAVKAMLDERDREIVHLRVERTDEGDLELVPIDD